jgi:AAA family ATP:ADP antiporter
MTTVRHWAAGCGSFVRFRFGARRSGEVIHAFLLAGHAFLLMVAYYVLKTVREPLLLTGGSAELKSYAQGTIAAVLLAAVPVIAHQIRHFEARTVLTRLTVASIAVLGAFVLTGTLGIDVGFIYYVWVGVFGVTMLAQFWSHASRRYDPWRGSRPLAFVMGGAAIGGLIGSPLCAALFPVLGPWYLLGLGATLLALTLPLIAATGHGNAEYTTERCVVEDGAGIATVIRNPQLRLLAALVIVINCVNSTGEYLLSVLVMRDAAARVAADPSLDRGALIASFYGTYFFAVNVLTALLQLAIVPRLVKFGDRALSVVALLAFVAYGMIALVPAFLVVRVVKVLENSVDYSLVNTLRQVLYLDHAAAVQRQGRAIIDALCYRLGDLLHAGLVAIGVNTLGFSSTDFAWLNIVFAGFWVLLAVELRRRRRGLMVPGSAWRRIAVPACCIVLALGWLAPSRAEPAPQVEHLAADLFAVDVPLELTLEIDADGLCYGPRVECEPTPAVLGLIDEGGAQRRLPATVRVRGQWRAARSNCSVPPLFVELESSATQGTPFAAHTALPLTSHCRAADSYEQYVLKEYLAYRIYGLLADASLRVRLGRVTYHVIGERSITRYAFFTENFATLARRRGENLREAPVVLDAVDSASVARLELFEYLIGNTDWSMVNGHNVVSFARADGSITVVPYDFDFSGLVDARYAGPSEKLPIRRVTQRLFRGICRPAFNWRPVLDEFMAARSAIDTLIASVPALSDDNRERALSFVAGFYATIASPREFDDKIARACRSRI